MPRRKPTHAAVACVRPTAHGPEVLVVHTRSGRWVLPKGRVASGEDTADAAAREASEEAGAMVLVDEKRRTTWRHRRQDGSRVKVELHVGSVLTTSIPDETWRRPTWVPLATLAALAREDKHVRRMVKAMRKLGLMEAVTPRHEPARATVAA